MSWIDFIQGMYFFGGVKMSDTEYMKLAIKLAKKGAGYVNPNPMVGAVIVKDNRIIGQGYHEIFGGLHAERNALKNCRESPVGATLYVTLEPCCHYGKTPPCTEAIIKSGITRVVVGTLDCNPIVSGKGVKVLEENNIQVVIGILEMECQQLIKVFRKYVTRHIPYVFMKYAMTMDGKIATYTNQSKWISGEKARKQVHQFRHKVTAIMVGVNTVIQDDPLLTCRLENGENPIRIVCDTDLRTPITSKIIKTANDIKTYIATSSIDESKIALYRKCGCEIIYTKKKGNHIDLMNLMQCLGNMQIDSLLLEGGSAMNWSALEQQIVDEVQIYIAPKIFGGSAKSPVSGQGVAFPNLMIQMYRSGEASGNMDKTALTMSDQYSKDHRIKGKTKSAMMYPIILIVITIAVLLIVYLAVLPSFFDIFQNVELPLITKINISISKFLQDYWYFVIMILVGLVAIFIALLRVDKVRFKVDKLKIKIPKFGKLLMTIYTSRFARTLCSLYTSGMSIVNALNIAKTTIGNVYIESQFDGAIKKLRNGESLSQAIKDIDGFDIKLTSSIFVGEESGRLESTLTTLADDFDFEAEQASERMITLIQPLMIIFLAVVICLIIISVLLPIYTLYNNVGNM